MNFPLQYRLCLLLILLIPAFANAQSYSNISLGSFLKAANDNHSWISPLGDFAFGFQQIGEDGFLLAIWFNKLPEKTIVWSADRNNLVQRGSVVQLTTNGEFILNDQSGKRIWAANPDLNEVSYAAMLDTGNFVLADKDGANLWASFDHPTDTILPTQTLNQGGTLIARYLESNYSNGRFMFVMQKDGNLVMYTTNYPFTTTNNSAYWSTQNFNGSGYQVIFNQSGYIFLAASNGSILNFVTNNSASTQDFYQRATIDYDGVFRQYVYPKTNSSRRAWKLGWNTLSLIPSDICSSMNGDTGSGACGFNSYCKLGDDQRPSCLCPPGYDFLDPNDERKGCTQKFEAQRCDDAFQDTSDLFELHDMAETKWAAFNYDLFGSQTEDWCRQACLSDCYCAVAVFRDGYCFKKRLPLSNGRVETGVGGKSLIKVRKGNPPLISKEKDQSTLVIIGSVVLGCSILVHLVFLVATRFNQRKQKGVEPLRPPFPAIPIQNFTYNELENATGRFVEEVGRGSFGTVYKGILPDDHRVVAVKKLDRAECDGEDGFRAEMSVIGKTNHRNLVQLLGFCNEGQHRLLVYEYMSNGSVAKFLFGDSKPQWYTRIQIALGIARGLFYLHEECSSQIIHCDIKPQNILLDESLSAKISDFGLSKFLKIDQTRTTTNIRGTKGYVAPEWFRNLPITVKVDVYSFGILLLELISCRRNVELDMKDEQQIILADWACDCYSEGKFHLLVEEDQEAIDDMKRVEKFAMIAIWCIQEDPSLRPGMKKVVQMLEGSVHVAAPPHPSSFISTI